LEKTYGAQGSVKFAAVSYKDDWKPVREIRNDGQQMLAKLNNPAEEPAG
jgi:hypothetical protein